MRRLSGAHIVLVAIGSNSSISTRKRCGGVSIERQARIRRRQEEPESPVGDARVKR